ncbi:MAG: PAS domain S-box protein, partial [Syntrophomonadaceae bacterium]
MSEIKSQVEIAELEHEILALRAENKELRSMQEIFSKAFHENQTCMAISRQDTGVFVDVNENYARTLGFSKEEMIGKAVVELGIWGEMEDRQAMHQELLEKGYVKDVVYKFKRRTGELGHGLATINIVDIHGEKHLLTSFIDITERKTAQQALAASQKLFEQIFNSIPLAIIINSFDGTVLEVNDAFLSRNKIKRQDIIGTNNVHTRIWREADRLLQYLMDIRQYGLVKNMEAEYYAPWGKVRTVLLSGILINWKGEDCALTISNDITEIRQYETEISRLDHLNLMGQMAASI